MLKLITNSILTYDSTQSTGTLSHFHMIYYGSIAPSSCTYQ